MGTMPPNEEALRKMPIDQLLALIGRSSPQQTAPKPMVNAPQMVPGAPPAPGVPQPTPMPTAAPGAPAQPSADAFQQAADMQRKKEELAPLGAPGGPVGQGPGLNADDATMLQKLMRMFGLGD